MTVQRYICDIEAKDFLTQLKNGNILVVNFNISGQIADLAANITRLQQNSGPGHLRSETFLSFRAYGKSICDGIELKLTNGVRRYIITLLELFLIRIQI
jgi:hypothetical protein